MVFFLSVNKNRLKKTFNEDIKGFHFYDVSFTFENYIDGTKIGIMYDVRITHKSIGQTNQEWEDNRIKISNLYSEFLPKKILKDKNSILKILLLVKKYIKENYNSLNTHELTIVSESVEYSKNIFEISTIPSTFLGDGITQIGVNKTVSVKNRLYKTKQVDYDLIISDSELLSNKIKYIYPNTKHIFIGEKKEIHSSVEFIKNLNYEDIHLLSNNNISKPKVKVLTGFSNQGGSTFAISRLVNYFNKNDIPSTMYGPHDYHLNLCNSDLSENLSLNTEDILITHFINLKERPNVKKVILFCHEKNLFEVSKMKPYWDEVVFLNNKHKNYHSGYDGKYTIIPNFKEFFEVSKTKDSINTAGIIGSIDINKQTHKSIERALNDGYQKVILFGTVTDIKYYQDYVSPLIDGKNVIEYGFTDDKEKIYSMVNAVYQSSLSEVASLVKEECEMTGTKFNGNSHIDNDTESLSDEEIFKKWKNLLKL